MLLKTNGVREFDDAVQSRIYIGLSYGPLGPNTRRGIWESFLTMPNAEGKVVSFSVTDLEDLAERNLNSRQVSAFIRI